MLKMHLFASKQESVAVHDFPNSDDPRPARGLPAARCALLRSHIICKARPAIPEAEVVIYCQASQEDAPSHMPEILDQRILLLPVWLMRDFMCPTSRR